MNVVASIFPIYLITKLFVSNVTYLVPPNVNIHTYEPTLQDILKVKNANYFVGAGYIINPWERKITLLSNAKYIDLSKGANLIFINGEVDPHYWNSPKEVLYIYKRVLKNYFPNETGYKNIKSLDKLFENTFKTCKIKVFITTHPAWRYLARDYHLKQITLSQENYISPLELANIERAIKKYHIKAILAIPKYYSKLAEYLSKKYHLKIYYVNPCIFGNKTTTYIDVMRYNIKVFAKAMECEVKGK